MSFNDYYYYTPSPNSNSTTPTTPLSPPPSMLNSNNINNNNNNANSSRNSFIQSLVPSYLDFNFQSSSYGSNSQQQQQQQQQHIPKPFDSSSFHLNNQNYTSNSINGHNNNGLNNNKPIQNNHYINNNSSNDNKNNLIDQFSTLNLNTNNYNNSNSNNSQANFYSTPTITHKTASSINTFTNNNSSNSNSNHISNRTNNNNNNNCNNSNNNNKYLNIPPNINNNNNNEVKKNNYKQIHETYQKYSNDINFERRIGASDYDSMASMYKESHHLPSSQSVILEGFMYYNVVVMGEPKGTFNDNRWFVQRGNFLFNHLAKDIEPIDVIDLKRLILNIDIRIVDDSSSAFRYGFSLSTPNNSISHFLWSDDPKQCILWLVSIASYTTEFNQDKEMNMINQILEISQPEFKPKKVLHSQRNSYSQQPQQQKRKSIFETNEIGKLEDFNFEFIFKNGLLNDIFNHDKQKQTIKLISKNPEDKSIVVDNISKLLLDQEFDLGQTLVKQIEMIENKISCDLPIEEISESVHNIIYEYTQICLHKLPELSKTEQRSGVCRFAVENSIFTYLYQTILSIYTHKYHSEDEELSTKATQFLTITPVHLGIAQKFWLVDGNEDDSDVNSDTTTPPYQDAIDLMKKLPTFSTPTEKIELLINVSDSLCKCISNFWNSRPSKPNNIVLGADDLLPLFTYVIIKSKVNNLHSEMMFIQDYLDQDLNQTVQGYFLVTFQTCLSLINYWNLDEILNNASTQFENIKKSNSQDLINDEL